MFDHFQLLQCKDLVADELSLRLALRENENLRTMVDFARSHACVGRSEIISWDLISERDAFFDEEKTLLFSKERIVARNALASLEIDRSMVGYACNGCGFAWLVDASKIRSVDVIKADETLGEDERELEAMIREALSSFKGRLDIARMIQKRWDETHAVGERR